MHTIDFSKQLTGAIPPLELEDIQTRTELIADDLDPALSGDRSDTDTGVSSVEIEEANLLVNPDVNSLESRG